jgi:hypothetical protein
MAGAGKEYTIGKGKVYFNAFATGTLNPIGERFLGNCPGFSFVAEAEYVEHYQSTGGVKVKDESVAIQFDSSGKLMIDNLSSANLAMFLFGTTVDLVQTAGAISNESITIRSKDAFYQVGVSTVNPTGVRKLDPGTPVVVTDGPAVITYVSGVDYTFDYDLGRLYVLPGSTMVIGAPVLIDYTKLATTRNHVASGATQVEGQIRFIADNPVGIDKDVFMPYVKLTPAGEVELIGDDWIELEFDLDVLTPSTGSAVYIDGRPLT